VKVQFKRIIQLSFISCLLFPLSLIADGKLKGTVTDILSGEPLPFTNVFLEGTSIGAATTFEGEFDILQIPAGDYNVLITYVGYKKKSMPITIVSGKTLLIDIELEHEAYEGEEVVITAQAQGQIEAINQQLSSQTIKNVVSADRIQDIPDANAAESVARLPGISLIRSGGEGQKVAIRGLSPKYNIMMVNGVRMQSTDRENRSVDLNMIAPNILSGIEVTKAITADMDADAVGGAVNLKISEASKGFKSKLSLQSGYGSVADKYGNYKGNILASNRFFEDKLGVQVSASLDYFDRYSDVLSAGYAVNEEDEKIDGLAVIDLDNVSIRDRVTERERVSGGLVLDYKFGNGSLILNNFISNLSENKLEMENSFGLLGNQFTAYTDQDELSNTVFSNALQGEFSFGFLDMDVDFALSNSVSKQDRPADLRLRTHPEQNQAGFSTDLDQSASPSEFLNSVLVYNDLLRTAELTVTSRDIVETSQNALLNFKIPYTITDYISGHIKFGGKYLRVNRDNEEEEIFNKPDRHSESEFFIREMMDSLWTDLGLELTDLNNGIRAELFVDPDYDIGDFLSGKENVDNFYYTSSISQMNRFYDIARNNGGLFIDAEESFQRDYEYTGTVSSFYLMTELNIGKYITLLPGIRYENWETDYFAYGTHKWGSLDFDYFQDEAKSKSSKDNWFPQLHLRIRPTDWLDIRLASTKSVIYPDYRAISPYYYYNTNGQPTLTLGNPNLVPPSAKNYDIYASVYENHIGLFTLGFFYKEMDNLIESYSYRTRDSERIRNVVNLSEITNTAVDTWINVESTAYVRGFEIDWQTHFWYLPSFLKGLVFNINYTHMSSESNYPIQVLVKKGDGIFAPTELVDSTRGGRLIDQPNDILNATIGYDIMGFSARLSFVYQDNVLGGISRRAELDPFSDAHYRWDLIVNQKLPVNGLQLFLNINNITNRPDRRFVSVLELLSSADYYGTTADIGVRYDF